MPSYQLFLTILVLLIFTVACKIIIIYSFLHNNTGPSVAYKDNDDNNNDDQNSRDNYRNNDDGYQHFENKVDDGYQHFENTVDDGYQHFDDVSDSQMKPGVTIITTILSI